MFWWMEGGKSEREGWGECRWMVIAPVDDSAEPIRLGQERNGGKRGTEKWKGEAQGWRAFPDTLHYDQLLLRLSYP